MHDDGDVMHSMHFRVGAGRLQKLYGSAHCLTQLAPPTPISRKQLNYT